MKSIPARDPGLSRILRLSEADDSWEEPAQDWLEDHHIRYSTHSRNQLIALAWTHGWRPF